MTTTDMTTTLTTRDHIYKIRSCALDYRISCVVGFVVGFVVNVNI